MRVWQETFWYPTIRTGKKVKVVAQFAELEGKKPSVQVMIKSQLHKSRMSEADYSMLYRLLADIFDHLRKFGTFEGYDEKMRLNQGPKMTLREKLAVAKASFKHALT
jgi:hypothetical protein